MGVLSQQIRYKVFFTPLKKSHWSFVKLDPDMPLNEKDWIRIRIYKNEETVLPGFVTKCYESRDSDFALKYKKKLEKKLKIFWSH